MRRLAYGSTLTVALVCACLAVSPSKASTISCTTNCGSGGPYAVAWSVEVDAGITLEAAYYLWKDSTPAGPRNQSPIKVTDAVEALAGLSSAALVDKGHLSSGEEAGSNSADVYALHFGPNRNGKSNDIVLVFSGATTLTDVTVQGLRNFRSFDIANSDPPEIAATDPPARTTTPLPTALPLFAGGLGALGLFGWRKKRKVQATAAAEQ